MSKNPNAPGGSEGSGPRDAIDDGEDIAAEVSPLVVNAIGDALRAHYRAIAEVPLPDRFMVLLAELEARERHNDA